MLTTGDRVRVDVIGLPEPDFSSAPLGTVTNVNNDGSLIGVSLDEPFEGEAVMLLSPERLRLS